MCAADRLVATAAPLETPGEALMTSEYLRNPWCIFSAGIFFSSLGYGWISHFTCSSGMENTTPSLDTRDAICE